MAKQQHKPTTLDDLATMINEGFKTTAGKEDIKELRVEMSSLKSTMSDMAEELTATHEDVRAVRTTVTMLVTSDAAHEAAIESLRTRLERVERKVWITK